MVTTNNSTPAGFVRFEPYWINKIRQRLAHPLQRIGYDVFISQGANTFLQILSPYQLLALSQKLYSLAANPRSKEAKHKKHTTDKYYIPESNTGFNITYEIINGGVYITSIVPDPDAKGEHKETPGVYHVTFERDTWRAKRLATYEVKTKYAAVNGQSNVLSRAKDLMADHVSYTYDKNLKEYTLFHNPSDGGMWDTYESSQDKFGKTTGVSKEFSKVLEGVQSGGTDVKWLAHSQGGIIFAEAVRYHVVNGGGTLAKNSVTFDAGANNKDKTQRYLTTAGIKILGYNDHPFDLVPQIVGGHAKSISNVVGAVLHAGYVLNGTPEHSPHTLPYQGMDNYVKHMPHAYQAGYKGIQSVNHGINYAVDAGYRGVHAAERGINRAVDAGYRGVHAAERGINRAVDAGYKGAQAIGRGINRAADAGYKSAQRGIHQAVDAGYKGAQVVGHSINQTAEQTREASIAAYKYIEDLPSHVKVMFKLFKK